MNIDHIFDYVEIKTPYMESLLNDVISKIRESIDLDELSLGPLIEGPTLSGEAGEVDEAGYIRLDSSKLESYDHDVTMAIIAHEFAHYRLGHYGKQGTLEDEDKADDLASDWGFNIRKFRAVCGPATRPKNL